jgi:hypothetical protein
VLLSTRHGLEYALHGAVLDAACRLLCGILVAVLCLTHHAADGIDQSHVVLFALQYLSASRHDSRECRHAVMVTQLIS